MKIKAIVFVTLLFICLGMEVTLSAGDYSFSGYMPLVKKENGALTISIDSLQTDTVFYIYYRTTGVKTFQVRKMESDPQGHVYYHLDTQNLYGDKVEYFIVEDRSQHSNTMTPIFTVEHITSQDSPEIYFQDSPETAASTPAKEPLFKISASASATQRLHEKNESTDPEFDANGNLRLYRNIYNEKYEFDFDTNFTYMHNVSEEESEFNLSEMKIRYKRGIHEVSAGDLSIDNTEFTTSTLSRRGLFYRMESKRLYLSSFFTNSQQKTGFAGFGIPPSDANIFGATAGVNLGEILKVRGMFMMGKDNLDSKTVVSSDDVVREGTVFSIWGQLDAWKNHLILKGEFARSNFGRAADSDSLTKESDTAWRGEADFTYGVVTGHADYKKVGELYNSIANLFLQNDREGLNSNLGLMIKSFALNLRYIDQKTNLTSTVQPMLHTKNIGADFSWLVANHIQLGAEFSLDNLDYDESSGLMTGTEDMDTIRYAATMGYVAGNNGITLKIGKTKSENFTSNVDASAAVNLKFGNVLSFNPSFSFQSTENYTDDSTSKIYNVYLSSELTFVPEMFSFAVTGSWTKNDNTYGDTTTLSAEGLLSFFMAKIFKNKIQPTLSLRGKYEDFKTGGVSTDNVILYLQADLSF